MLVEFASAVDAVRCAVDVQRGMAERNETVPLDQRIEFRIGINVGDIIGDGADIYGDGVNVAARLETMAAPGGICVSRAVRDPVRDKLAFGFDDLGEVWAKNIARPIHVFRVRHDSEQTHRWTHWGTTEALRHVRPITDGVPDEPPRPSGEAAFRVSFWSADWTPWRALARLASDWPALRFTLQPRYETA